MAYFGCINRSSSPPIPPAPREYYAKFTGQGQIVIPQNNIQGISLGGEYNTIFIDFELTNNSLMDSMFIYGNSINSTNKPYFALTTVGKYRYTIDENGAINLDEPLPQIGRHTFLYNEYQTRNIYLDGNLINICQTLHNANANHILCGHGNNVFSKFIGKIYRFQIKYRDVLYCDIQPTEYNGEMVFRDIINNINYSCDGMTIENEEV